MILIPPPAPGAGGLLAAAWAGVVGAAAPAGALRGRCFLLWLRAGAWWGAGAGGAWAVARWLPGGGGYYPRPPPTTASGGVVAVLRTSTTTLLLAVPGRTTAYSSTAAAGTGTTVVAPGSSSR